MTLKNWKKKFNKKFPILVMSERESFNSNDSPIERVSSGWRDVDKKCVKGILKNSKFKSRNPKESRKISAIKICKSQVSKIHKPVKGMRTMAEAIKRAGIR